MTAIINFINPWQKLVQIYLFNEKPIMMCNKHLEVVEKSFIFQIEQEYEWLCLLFEKSVA